MVTAVNNGFFHKYALWALLGGADAGSGDLTDDTKRTTPAQATATTKWTSVINLLIRAENQMQRAITKTVVFWVRPTVPQSIPFEQKAQTKFGQTRGTAR
jgi:hypothetical protein